MEHGIKWSFKTEIILKIKTIRKFLSLYKVRPNSYFYTITNKIADEIEVFKSKWHVLYTHCHEAVSEILSSCHFSIGA